MEIDSGRWHQQPCNPLCLVIFLSNSICKPSFNFPWPWIGRQLNSAAYYSKSKFIFKSNPTTSENHLNLAPPPPSFLLLYYTTPVYPFFICACRFRLRWGTRTPQFRDKEFRLAHTMKALYYSLITKQEKRFSGSLYSCFIHINLRRCHFLECC